ncbi:MAG: hypothetical protein ABW046_10035 [Actinoplanes sp.]
MEGHRYADDPESTWYPGKSQYARSTDPEASGSHAIGNPYDSGIHERPSGAFRLPDQRAGAAPYSAVPDSVASTGSHAFPVAEPETTRQPGYESGRIPVRGPEYPTIKPPAEPAPPAELAPMAQPTTLVPPVTPGERPRPEQVYQTRRPVTSVIVAVVMVILMIPVVRLLIESTFTGDPTARGIVPAVLLTLGFTLTGIGLFAVARGGPIGREAWLRPPVAYLPAGLLLLFAAGLAVA